MQEKKLLLFLHLPKTAGTSINRILLDQYARQEVVFLHDEAGWSTSRLVDICNQRSQELRAVSGHFPFGIHELVNTPTTYMTFLRHPLELLLSMYHYFLRTPIIPTSHVVSQLSFAQFVKSQDFDFLTSNLQTRFLCGNPNGFCHRTEVDYLMWKPGDYTPDLERAKEHLSSHFSFVGITEWSPECFLAMGNLLGWQKTVPQFRENVTANRPALSTLEQDVLDTLHEKNRLDLQLYEYAKELYRSRFATR